MSTPTKDYCSNIIQSKYNKFDAILSYNQDLFYNFNTKMSEEREINTCGHRFTRDLKCLKCGLYNYKSQAIKTTKYSSPFHFNLRHYLNSLRRSASKIVEPVEINEQTYLLLTSICEKFLFTHETLALGLYIYQSLQKLNNSQKFWASSALIVAGKAVELDKNVPYLNRYQRYAEKSFSQQDYEQAERTIFQAMNFEVQHSTFITFIDFYLTCGVLFREDCLNCTLVQFFEDDVMVRAREFLKKGTFTRFNPELLALGIIKEVRQKYSLKGWNSHLQELAGYCEDEITAMTPTESPLKEISSNHTRLGELKGLSVRKKYENLIKHDAKPTVEKYVSISKSTTLKENSYSSSKLLLHQGQSNSRKPSQTFMMVEGFSTLNSDLLSKRR